MTTHLSAEHAAAILEEVEQRCARTLQQVEEGCRLLTAQGAGLAELRAYTDVAARRFESEMQQWLRAALDRAGRA